MFTFERFEENHLSLLRQWLNARHIKHFWQESDDEEKLKVKFLDELPRQGVLPFVIAKDHEPIGYIQYYDATKVGGGWLESELIGTFGIDLMIGSSKHHGRGFGPTVIKEFVDYIREKEPSLKCIIIDPDPKNRRAIRAFEKAGFAKESEIETPDGTALLMRMTF
jgi:RimJ/RimL family protein N-acetyltransferase